ncbi:MAG: transglutaminase domain-containing protein, partial [Nitrospirota bacterium]
MIIHRILLAIICTFIPFNVFALDADIENDLQKDLLQSRNILERAEEKIESGQPADDEVKALINNLENIKASHLLLQERFNERQETVKALGTRAVERQLKMVEGYSRALKEYINLVESLAEEGNKQLAIRKLRTLLDKVLYKKKTPILGSLPYKNLNYPAKEPDTSTSVEPAYQGGDAAATDDDLKATENAPLSEEIVYHAQSLQWNPVEIYEWVKNNVETEWYWGCMKGAEETLRQKSGNGCDQASLLIALLRVSGFPSRYVRGVIELESEQLKNLTGINDESGIAAFLQKAGIPFKPVIRGGTIGAFEIEHIWVESEIPYSNYRGAIIDEQGKGWLGLDTAIKVAGYEYNDPVDIPQEISISNIREEYLSTPQSITPLEYIGNYLNTELGTLNTGLTYNDLLSMGSLIPEVLNILPASMQYEQKMITGEYTDIPDELTHKVRFIAADINDSELLNYEIGTALLSNQKVSISYEPETVEDQEIINSYGGLDNTPSYLVKLRPVLMLNGERLVVARDGLPMGADYKLTIELISPNGTEKIKSVHVVGNLSVIGLVSQRSTKGTKEHEEKDAEQILFEEAINYIDRWNEAEDELASLMRVALARPIPSVAIVGGVIDVTYLLDMPHGFEWKGVFVDASLRSLSPVQSSEFGVQSERKKTFMQLSALHGSVLEHRIFEDDFGVGSISTAKLFTLNSELGTQNIVIDQSNIHTALPSLSYDDNIKDDIANAVNQGLVVTIPETESVYEDWTGTGYIKEDLETGEAGYMLSGNIAGGMSAWGVGRWPESLAELLSNPFTDPPNYDPLSGSYIEKITSTDFQSGIVNESLPKELQVKVTDEEGKAVKGAEVTFSVKAGGGTLSGGTSGGRVVTVQTNFGGFASAGFRLGKRTGDNPTFMKINSSDEYYSQVGENIVEVSLSASGTKTKTPFTAFGKPGDPFKIADVYGGDEIVPEDDGWHFIDVFESWGELGLVNTTVGSIQVEVRDRHENPISNELVTFRARDAIPMFLFNDYTIMDVYPVLPPDCRNLTFYKQEECSTRNFPLYGECPAYGYEGCYPSGDYGDDWQEGDVMLQHEGVTVKTQFFGAIVETMMGNTVATGYRVQVTAESLAPEINLTYYYASLGYRLYYDQVDPDYEPVWYIEPELAILSRRLVDDQGNPANVAKIGEQLKYPLTSRLILLRDNYIYVYQSGGAGALRPTYVYSVRSTGTTSIEPVENGTVTYTVEEGSPYIDPQSGGESGHGVVVGRNGCAGSECEGEELGNGFYSAGYITGMGPGENVIRATGKAVVTVPEILGHVQWGIPGQELGSCLSPLFAASESQNPPLRDVEVGTGEQIYFIDWISPNPDVIVPIFPILSNCNPDGERDYTEYINTGVDIQIESPTVVLVDEIDESGYGYSINDLNIDYTIFPETYKAYMAYVALLEDGIPVSVIPSEEIGTGSVTFSAGFQFDMNKSYEVEVVLNPGAENEMRSDSVPVVLLDREILGTEAKVERVYHLSQFEGTIGPEYSDSYQAFDFEVQMPSTVSVKILDASLNEKDTFVAETPLAAGSYNFVVDYETIYSSGFSTSSSPEYYLQLLIEPDDNSPSEVTIYPGTMSERTNGKMLGQTMVHDVLIQDGSLNLSRQDFALKGRGPQLAFSRSYNNQSSAAGHRPLGEGWSYSLDMRLWPLSLAESITGSVP